MSNSKTDFQKNKKGSVAVEFAIILPLLLLMFFGSFELARYIMVSRKVDNTANDIAFVFAREGDLYLDDKGNPRTVAGANLINQYTAALVPMLMYPFDTKDYALDIRYVGWPTNATINPNHLRVMWAQGICGSGGTMNPNTGLCPGTSPSNNITINVSPFTQPTDCAITTTADTRCVYLANGVERAKILLRGQAFVLVNFGYKYNMVLNQGTATGGLSLTGTLERLATYPARSRWIDSSADGLVQSNEFANNMFRCNNCSPLSSSYTGPGSGSTTGSTAALRSNCTFIHNGSSQEDKNTKGCRFN